MAHRHHGGFDSAQEVARLEREGEATAGIDAKAIERCRTALGGLPVRRIADLGSGPGVASAALAATFPTATVVAVDGSAAMLERAATRGVETVRLDLDGDLWSLGAFELVWASMALHHLPEATAALARFASLVRPGGVLCLLEHADPRSDNHPSAVRAAGLDLVADETLSDGLSRRLLIAGRPAAPVQSAR